jgi:hypothetical protein
MIKKKVLLKKSNTLYIKQLFHYFFGLGSEDTLKFFLPLARLLANTFLPDTEAIRSLNPCLFLLFLFDGW